MLIDKDQDFSFIKSNKKILLNIFLLLISLFVIKFFCASSAAMNMVFLIFFFINFALSPKFSYLLYIPFSLFFEHNFSTEIPSYIFAPLSSNMMLFKNWTDIFHNEIFKFSSFDIILLTYVIYFLLQKYYNKKEIQIPHVNILLWGYISYLILFFLWGFIHKSDPFAAYWQIKPLAYLPFIYILTWFFIDGISDVYFILSGIFAATLFKLFQTYYFANLIAPDLTIYLRALSLSHEETLFYILMIFILFFTGKFNQNSIVRLISYLLILFPIGGLIYAKRRISFALLCLFMSIISVFYMGPKQKNIQISLVITFIIIVPLFSFLVYSSAKLPFSDTAKSVATGVGLPVPSASNEDLTSNYYRMIEQTNLKLNIKDNFIGQGFGAQLKEKYQQNFHWVAENIFAHNQILQMWALTGVFGYTIFLAFWAWLISYITYLHKVSKDPLFSVISICIVCYIVAYLLYSYYDIILMEFRQNIILGLLIASVFKLKELVSDN